MSEHDPPQTPTEFFSKFTSKMTKECEEKEWAEYSDDEKYHALLELYPVHFKMLQHRYSYFSDDDIHDVIIDSNEVVLQKFDPERDVKYSTYLSGVIQKKASERHRKLSKLKCQQCKGRGEISHEKCPTCEGGWVDKPKSIHQESKVLDHLASVDPVRETTEELRSLLRDPQSGLHPLRPFTWNKKWFRNQSAKSQNLLLAIQNSLTPIEQAVWWAYFMDCGMVTKDLGRAIGPYIGKPEGVARETVSRRRASANEKVQGVLEGHDVSSDEKEDSS